MNVTKKGNVLEKVKYRILKIWTWANTILIRSISNFHHENFEFDKNDYKKTKTKYFCNAISKEFKKKKNESVCNNLKLWSE